MSVSRAMDRLLGRRTQQPGSLRWKPGQYEASACNGLGTAGGVCPAVLLPCRIRLAPWDADVADRHDCLVQPLPEFGFNAVVTPAPAGMLRALRQSYPRLRYIGVDRFEPNNRPVHCRNPHVRVDGTKQRRFSSSELLLLDRSLRVLDRQHISGGDCINGRWRVNDARLL
eukprot:5972942-Prymnesium_polylepis.1